jgi:outer membrane protein TolC
VESERFLDWEKLLNVSVQNLDKLANVNLIPDFSVSGSYSHTATETGGFAQPADNTLGASVSVNLPFSRLRHRGEIEAAPATRTQAELQLHSTQLKVKEEVPDAYSRYEVSFGSHQTLTLASVDLDPRGEANGRGHTRWKKGSPDMFRTTLSQELTRRMPH